MTVSYNIGNGLQCDLSIDATSLPDDMIKTLVASRNANAGLLNMRQVTLYCSCVIVYQLCDQLHTMFEDLFNDLWEAVVP